MTRLRRPAVLLWLAVLVAIGFAVVGVAAGAAAAATDDAGTADREVGPITTCFEGDGYPLAIGDDPATIDARIHMSVLTSDWEHGNEFGVELAGQANGERIVTLAGGVRLKETGLLLTGMNPFAAFDVVYTYEFRIPAFDGHIGESRYEEESPPISSAATTVDC